MSKYWQVFKLAWQRNFEYRANTVGHLVLGLISIVIPILIFKHAFAQGATFGDYTFSSLFTYLVMTKFMHFAGRGNIVRKIAAEIKSGDFSNYLQKPINYQKYWLSYTLSDRIFEICIRLLMLVSFMLIYPNLINLRAGNLPLFILFIPFAITFNFFFSLVITYISFYIIDIRMFTVTLGIVLGFLAGDLIPIDLMPKGLSTIAMWLPFRFTTYFPIMVYQGKISGYDYWLGVLSSVVWIIAFALLAKLMWRKGIKYYEAVGR